MKKGVSKMLSVEITAVLALVFTFFIYATLRARRTQERRRNEVRTWGDRSSAGDVGLREPIR